VKALVTGGTGFIGSHLVNALLDNNWSVRCLVRGTGNASWLEGLSIERCPGDCCDPMSLPQAVQGVDVVFHLAGVTKALDERTYFTVNAAGTDNLVRACLECNPKLKTFLYVSSQAAAGPSAGCPSTEEDRCEPVSAYGRSKRQGEELALAFSAKIPVVVVRPPVVYGPRDRALLPLFKLLSWGIQPRLAGRGQRFSVCYVKDIVRGLLLAAQKDEARGHIFFLSDGRDYGWKEIGNAFARAVGRRASSVPLPRSLMWGYAAVSDAVAAVRRKPALLSCGKVKEMVQAGWVCDSGKSRRLLGFEPHVGVDEGARLTYAWYKEAKWL
jgi:dihydroflavonol-4-reductase